MKKNKKNKKKNKKLYIKDIKMYINNYKCIVIYMIIIIKMK